VCSRSFDYESNTWIIQQDCGECDCKYSATTHSPGSVDEKGNVFCAHCGEKIG
jgi:hypothetical protein